MVYRSPADKYKKTQRRRLAMPPAVAPETRQDLVEVEYQPAPGKQRQPVAPPQKQIASLDKQRRKRRKAGSMRLVSGLILAIVCVVGGYFFAKSPIFTVTEIVVEGNSLVSVEKATELSGLTTGINLFAEQTDRAEQWLEINPYVEKAHVKRVLPNKVVIELTERRPAGIVVTDKAFLTIATDRMILSRDRKLAQTAYPLLTGVTDVAAGASAGSLLEGDQVEAGVGIINQMADEVYEGLSEINIADPQKICVFFNSGVEARIGDSSNFNEKYLLLTEILAEQKGLGKLAAIKYIDVSVLDKPVIFYNT